jgi:hypothetical protein
MSGWHIQPKGVKKPYNPVLGEFFRCKWEHPDQTQAIYVAEQVSHHPPISCYYYASPENHIAISGETQPKSRFLGNSAATLMQGWSLVEFTNRNEEYEITLPNIYARGILFGTMILELGDHASVRCDKNDLVCEIEFKTKGFFTGTYNAVHGVIKRISTGEELYEITGKWSDKLYLKSLRATAAKEKLMFDARSAQIYPKIVPPLEEQEVGESRKKWSLVTVALKSGDIDKATEEKNLVEDLQRKEAKDRAAEGVDWQSRFFHDDKTRWAFKYKNHALEQPSEVWDMLDQFIFQGDTGLDPAHRQRHTMHVHGVVDE